MKVISDNISEWAVNALGNVLLSTPIFYARNLICATLSNKYLIIHHDTTAQSAFAVPAPVLSYLAESPTVLVVTFNANGETTEHDLRIEGHGQAYK